MLHTAKYKTASHCFVLKYKHQLIKFDYDNIEILCSRRSKIELIHRFKEINKQT